MLSLVYKRNQFPFQYNFNLSKGSKTEQETLHINLNFVALKGWGEASAIAYHNVSIDGMIATLERYRMMIERYNFIEPERFWHFLHHLLHDDPFIVSALDMAGWDMYGQIKRQPVYKLLGLEWKDVPMTDYTLGIASTTEIQERIKKHPYPIYKMKVGNANDLESLRAARQLTKSLIRIDANEGWSLEDARIILPELEKLDIELIEQPLDKKDFEGMKELKKLTNIPIIADEAFQNENDLIKLNGLFDGVNVKLAKCSGISAAVELIKKSKSAGMKIMLGCMSEGIVGCTAMSHLLPLADYADLDGPLLLTDPTFSGIRYDGAKILEPQGSGLGLKKLL
ncbi:MAG TPA: dipeptide epimerase [Edaphocola sp.]|nr:dipeptide epimerase [Edaphocola sp.]